MVKAIRVYRTGGPEVLKYEEAELAGPARGEIRIKHEAIGVNYIDTYFRSGLYPAPMPYTLGNEAAGVVTAVGKGVTGFKVGDRAAYVAGLRSYAEEANVPAEVAVKLPKGISSETAAAMMLKGMTAEYLLRRTYKVREGDTVLVHAAAGGVGLILCQWAKALGATVIGTVGSPEKAALAKKNGARHTILYRDEDFVKRVAEITKGKKCQVVYDGVGKATFPGSLDCLAPLGMFVNFGNASGPVEAFSLLMLSQRGSLFATRPTLNTFMAQPGGTASMARQLFRVVENGSVKIRVTQRFPLRDAAAAHRALEGRETTGSIVLVP
ncbi:MAG: quinone oxidoreductase [Hyphomicrobiales bacterium]|nr:quinone oxidoreductase [Hyphomicrobiales bacterium]MBV9052656.1 quinone oxidoreductase [Hyphomicrobiales bacterium]